MIELRPFRKSDAASLQKLADNENVSRYLVDTFPFPYRLEDAVWWIETGSKQNAAINLVIELDGDLVGTVGITPQSGWRGHIAEIGYWVGEPHWGRGVGSAAVREMTRRAFYELDYRKLFAPVLSPNTASMRVLEKCGYERDGVFRDEVTRHGRFYDVHRFARHRS
jgi:ribosomal-protein-alanine N-acetyltransferase